MQKSAKHIVFCAAAVLLLCGFEQQSTAADRYYSIGVGMARCAAMGFTQTASAVASLQGIYNPATLYANATPEDDPFDLWIDPLGIWAMTQSREKLSRADPFSALDWLNWGGLLIRGIGGRYAALSFAAIINETLPDNPQQAGRKARFPMQGILDWQFSQTLLRVKLADAFSVGASLYMVTARGLSGALRKFGGSYGVLIRPGNAYSVGIMYIDVPNETAPLFMAWNRTIDEAMNVGISFQAQKNLLLSLDVRNVSEENQAVKRELHAGGEWQPWAWLSVRSGYFRLTETTNDVFSGGIGLGSLHQLLSPESPWLNFDLTLDYGIQIENRADEKIYTHFLTICTLL